MAGNWVEERLVAEGLSIDVDVWTDSRSPIINVRVLDSDPNLALTTAERLVEFIEEDLRRRQDALDAPDLDRILSQQITDSTISKPDFGSRNRARIAFAVVGLVLSCAAAFFLEGLLQIYRRFKLRQAALVMPPEHETAVDEFRALSPDMQPETRPVMPPTDLVPVAPTGNGASFETSTAERPSSSETSPEVVLSPVGESHHAVNGYVYGRIDPPPTVPQTYAWEAPTVDRTGATLQAAVTGDQVYIPPSILTNGDDTSIEDLQDEDENE